MSPTKISDLSEGEQASGFALLTKKELRTDRNNKEYLDLELSDATGSIAGKVWSDSPALKGDYEAHDFVAYKGSVSDFRGQLQLRVQECRRASEADREFGFDESELIPSTPEDIDDLWRRLGEALDEVQRPALQELTARAMDRWGAALREHPAAKTIHHAYRGGLLEHVVSMLELGHVLCRHYGDLDADLVALGILFHDLGKLREIGAMPVNEYTDEGRLVGHVVIGRDQLLEAVAEVPDFPADLRLQLEHIVLAHQGRREFGAPVEPMTPEALVVHFIDDLDAKLNQFRSLKGKGEGPHFLKGMGRYVYGMAGEDGQEESPPQVEAQAALDLDSGS
jgi:3'-5' exoribonuclease